jgi:hypothetical protein
MELSRPGCCREENKAMGDAIFVKLKNRRINAAYLVNLNYIAAIHWLGNEVTVHIATGDPDFNGIAIDQAQAQTLLKALGDHYILNMG